MEDIQVEIIRHLEEANGTEELVQLMIAAQIIESDALYKKALNGLIHSKPKITWEQAQKIGLKASYAILSPESSSNIPPMAIPGYCSSCDCSLRLYCDYCEDFK
jgi:hypothetical protein